MRNEQEFKALVLQKVREQQYQKQMRLQKIRAVSATLSAISLIAIGVVTIVWFVRINPDEHTLQDGVYGGAGAPQSWWESLFSRGSEEDAGWDDSAGMSVESGQTENHENNGSSQVPGSSISADSENSTESNKGAEGDKATSNVGGYYSDSVDSESKEPSLNEGSADSDGGNPQDTMPGNNDNSDAPNSGTTENIQTENAASRVTLDGISKDTAAMLALENGYTEDILHKGKILDAVDKCYKDQPETDKEPGELLFVLRMDEKGEHGFYFYDNNVLNIRWGSTDQYFEFAPADFQNLLRILRTIKLTPLN